MAFKPDSAQLEKARAKNSFILVVNGNYDNKIYAAWDTYTTRKGIELTNVSGWSQSVKLDSFKAITYWVKYKSPAIDLILAYAKAHPEAGMTIHV